MSSLNNFYRNFKKLRGDDRNFVTRVADSAGLSRAVVNDYLRGKGEPGLDKVARIAQALGVSFNDLIGDEPPPPPPPREPSADEMALHILEALLPTGAKRSLIKLVLEMDHPHAEALLGVAEKSLSTGDNESKLAGKCGSD
jgi:transcriptional regulator with XRE-family HTH domain